MILPDVNVLVYAARADATRHREYRRWLQERLNTLEPVGLPDLVVSGFLRVMTHPRIFSPPTPIRGAIEFVEALRAQSGCVLLAAGPSHWRIFTKLCTSVEAKGNPIPDAYLAALAIEHGAELVTTDRHFARFPGLRWRHPLE